MMSSTALSAPAQGVAQRRSNSRHLFASLLVVAGATFGAALFGLLSAVLSIETELGLAMVIAALVSLIVSLGILGAGISSRKWAIGLVFFVLVVAMEATFRRRELTATGLDAQTLAKLLVWCGALVIGLANFRYLGSALRASVGLRWLLAFALWATLSTVYSLSPTYTFGGGIAFLSLIAFVPQALERIEQKHVFLAVIYATGFLAISAIVLYFVAPSIAVAQSEGGRVPRLAGFTGSPNNLGRVASLGLLFIFFAFRDRLVGFGRLDVWAIALACAACLILSWSRTSAVALVVAIAVVLLRPRIKLLYVGLTLALVLLLGLVLADFNWNTLVRLVSRRGSVEELLTFTGRTAIWEFNWNKFLAEPLIGFGYGSTKLLMPEGFRTYMGWTSTSAHNMLLQALVTTGLIGGTLVLGSLAYQLRAFFRHPSDFSDTLFVYIVLSGLFEPGAVGVAPNMLTLVWVLALALPRHIKPVGQVGDHR